MKHIIRLEPAGEAIVARIEEASTTEFVRWYIDTFRGIDDDLSGVDIEGVPKQELAAQILNAFLFIGFTRAVLHQQDGPDIGSFVENPVLDAVCSRGARRKCTTAAVNRAARAIEGFKFSLVESDPDPASRVVSPGMLDVASEALSRMLAGDEKIASRGTFYTQQAEISFMCSVVVSRLLKNRFPRIPPGEIDHLVFGTRSGEGEKQQPVAAAIKGEARHMVDALLDMKVLDLACGSGAFLTGIAGKRREIISKLAAMGRLRDPDPESLAQRLVMTMTGVDSDALAVQVAKIRVCLWYLSTAGIHVDPPEGINMPSFDNNVVLADFFWFRPPGDAGAFDVVIGNPPYVRQEDIKPSRSTVSLPARAEKDRYKEALIDTLKEGNPSPMRLSRTCDLYVYFFIKAVQVLRPGGELCLLTSNTWLDAKFGQGLHDFLLAATASLSIFDFSRRSFGRADINTVITACTRRDGVDDRNPRVSFVHFRIPPERVLAIPALSEPESNPNLARVSPRTDDMAIDADRRVLDSAESRLVVVSRDGLISASGFHDKATGGKWRVDYLNEYDIYYTVLRKAAGKLVPLGSIATVNAGCYSGINEFFYVNRRVIDRFGIEEQYLRPLLRSARDVLSLDLAVPESSFIVAIPPVPKEELKSHKHDGVFSYITWGESQCTRRGQKTALGIPWPRVESVRHRAYWYSLSSGNLRPARLLMQYIAHDRFYCPWSAEPVVPDRCFHRVEPRAGIELDVMAALLNSTFQAFMVMVTGRAGLGGGALKVEALDAKSMLVLDPRLLSRSILHDLVSAIQVVGRRGPKSLNDECGLDPSKHYPGQVPSPLPDRAALDKVVFDVLGLSDAERDEVYIATCSAITNRLKKAREYA